MTVLGDRDIARNFGEIFDKGTASRSRIKAAKYDLTLGGDLLILPSGRRYADKNGHTPKVSSFLLNPGESALVSTEERISMPPNLAGFFGPSFDLSEHGVLLFGGMLVDPGFGFYIDEDQWIRQPEPLSFYLANLGSDPLQLRPGQQRVASMAFMEISDPRSLDEFEPRFEAVTARNLRSELFDSEHEDPPRTLGLVRGISELDHRVDKFEASTFHVVVFGVIVLAITLFAAIVSLVVSEPARPVVSDLAIEEVLLTVGLVVVELMLIGLGFWLTIAGTSKALRAWRRWRRRVAEIS